jgi:hypothetical protein
MLENSVVGNIIRKSMLWDADPLDLNIQYMRILEVGIVDFGWSIKSHSSFHKILHLKDTDDRASSRKILL